jgi:alkylation response protein AidB-like acyl-CoA dehydrogenase
MIEFNDEQRMMQETATIKVTGDAVQILGGYGVMKDCPLERNMREAKIIPIFEGMNQIQCRIAAGSFLSF